MRVYSSVFVYPKACVCVYKYTHVQRGEEEDRTKKPIIRWWALGATYYMHTTGIWRGAQSSEPSRLLVSETAINLSCHSLFLSLSLSMPSWSSLLHSLCLTWMQCNAFTSLNCLNTWMWLDSRFFLPPSSQFSSSFSGLHVSLQKHSSVFWTSWALMSHHVKRRGEV